MSLAIDTSDINPNLLSLIINHSTLPRYDVFEAPYSRRVKLKSTRMKIPNKKVMNGGGSGSGKLRPIKSFSFYDMNVQVPSTLFKSPPTSSAFFSVYTTTKSKLEYHAYCENIHSYVTDCLAVYLGHTASCIIRVPVDVVKQQSKVEIANNNRMNVFKICNK